MCVIIVNQKGKSICEDIIKTSSRLNPHGLGIIWLDNFEVTYHTSSEYKKLFTNRPFIAHFRYATKGAVNRDNTHPFRCGNNKNEWLMMNGTIHELGDSKTCDTKVLANMLGDMSRDKWDGELSKHECRFVTVNTKTKSFQMYNKHLWTKHDDVWYSKDNVLEINRIAVYGTLKKGFSNYYNFLLNTKHVGKGKTFDKYPLVVSGLPYLVEEKGLGHNVEVDVFKVSNAKLLELDKLEGHPKWYQRKLVPIQMKNKKIMCWIYFNNGQSIEGKELHKSYEQNPNKGYYFDDYQDYYDECDVVQKNFFLDQISDSDIMSDGYEPICIDCFNDLEHDGFNNYHCTGCDGWFSEDEILIHKP
jgi:gamma-glutamylcyclotransferase (GGCT)/AIG2-like uncharacterized protein YtfP